MDLQPAAASYWISIDGSSSSKSYTLAASGVLIVTIALNYTQPRGENVWVTNTDSTTVSTTLTDNLQVLYSALSSVRTSALDYIAPPVPWQGWWSLPDRGGGKGTVRGAPAAVTNVTSTVMNLM